MSISSANISVPVRGYRVAIRRVASRWWPLTLGHHQCLVPALVISLGMISGCRPQPEAGSSNEAVVDRNVDPVDGDVSLASAGDTGGEPSSLAEGTSESAPSAAGSGVFSHPIDQEPQGMQFREATRALDAGDFEKAEKIRLELKNSTPQFQPLATAIEALMLVKRGQLDQALRMAEDLSTLQVMQADSYVIAGEVFQIQNRLLEATNAFANALELNPEHVRAHLWIGALYYDTGAMRLATTHLRKAAELEPNEINALLLSAKIFQDYEQFNDAILDYRLALERITNEKLALNVKVRLAECLCEIRELEQAHQVLEQAPEVPAVLACRAAIAEANADFAKASELSRKALSVNPANSVAGMVLARIQLTERKWSEAQQVLETLVEASPYDHEPRLLLGRALVGAGDEARGQEEIQRATTLKDNFLKFADLHQEAIRNPEDANLRVELGVLAESLGKNDLARTWYRAALGLEAKHPQALEGLKRLNQ